jgi:spore photoproduct lyase
MFSRIFVEEDVLQLPRTVKIIEHFKSIDHEVIDRIDDYFGRVKKPYLQKRDNLNLYIGKKRGQLVKEAPNAYGFGSDPHYYFIHSYNCIYECEYCYLQGYFNSPDLVFFVNHEEIGTEIKRLSLEVHSDKRPWFHAGEFSDSLALSHITSDINYYFELFKELPNSFLEFRTKSVNVRDVLKQDPLDNIIISFSLSPKERAEKSDLGCPSTKLRIAAMKKVSEAGHQIAIHLDPIIYDQEFEKNYEELIINMTQEIDLTKVNYISVGVVRFTKDVYRQVGENYPDSDLLAMEFIKTEDGKVRYPRPVRMNILTNVQNMLIKNGFKSNQVYLCMED